MNTDLGDEAARAFMIQRDPIGGRMRNHPEHHGSFMDGWQECRRRAEMLMACMEDVHKALIEERERKAFEAGVRSAMIQQSIDDAYLAWNLWKEKNK